MNVINDFEFSELDQLLIKIEITKGAVKNEKIIKDSKVRMRVFQFNLINILNFSIDD